MQAVTPVDIHVDQQWSHQTTTKIPHRTVRPGLRMRTRVVNKVKPKKTKPSVIPSVLLPKQIVTPRTIVVPVRSRSSSPDRGPWVPPPGRSTKGQKVSWQSPRARVEIHHPDQLETPRNDVDHSSVVSPSLSTIQHENRMHDIQMYEKRVQALIDGIAMLKERVQNQGNPEQTDQLRSEIDASLLELEQLQNTSKEEEQVPNHLPAISRSRSESPGQRRSLSADETGARRRTPTKVSFQDDPIVEKRRARSTTPVRGPLHLNPDREALLHALTDSEADVIQITKQLSFIKDLLNKLTLNDQTASFQVEQLHRNHNELLYLIDQYERSNKKLKDFLRHQYHLEAEHGLIFDQYDRFMTRIHYLENENGHIRRLLLDREKDNINLQNEFERIRSQTIGFDTMKTSLEQNRAHLQRELYSKEGEIHRLQSALRALERDLHRNRLPGSRRVTPQSQPKESKTIEQLEADLTKRDEEIRQLKTRMTNGDTSGEIQHWKTRAEEAERLVAECKAQLNTETLKSSANNSRHHLSQLDLEEKRTRLQKRIDDLENLPELLKKEEMKNENLQKKIRELENDNICLRREVHGQIRSQGKSLEDIFRPKVNGSSSSTSTQFHHGEFDVESELKRLRHECAELRRNKEESDRRLNQQIKDLSTKLENANRTNHSLTTYLNSLRNTYATLFSDTIPSSVSRLTTT